MKKAGFLFIFCLSAGIAFAADESPELSFFIEGTAVIPDHRTFFATNFRMEADSLGYVVKEDKREAGYTFHYDVLPNVIVFDDGTTEPAPPDEAQFVIMMTLTRNVDDSQIVSFSFEFTDINEMYEYNQFLFFRAAVNIAVESGAIRGGLFAGDSEWQNKWLYLRASFDFPINFYGLDVNLNEMKDGKHYYINDALIPAIDPDKDEEIEIIHTLNNIVYALPAITLGAEVQFLDFMSAELFFKLGIEKISSLKEGESIFENNYLDMSLGLQLKFPFKFPSLVLSPYLMYTYQLGNIIPLGAKHDVMGQDHPENAIGLGLQMGLFGGNWGSVFVDVNYTYYIGDIPFKSEELDKLGIYQNLDDGFPYKRSIIGLSIGYKFGLFSR